MKKLSFIMKLTSAVAVSLLLTQQVIQGAVVVFTSPAGAAWNATNFFTVSARVNSVKIDTGVGGVGVTNLSYALIDTPITAGGVGATNGWGPINFTNFAYTNVVQYTTNLTKTITNFAGLGATSFPAGSTITNIITISNALFTVTNIVGQSSNTWRRIVVGQVSSNSVVTSTGPFIVNFGLGFTNNNIGVPITLTIDYDPLQ